MILNTLKECFDFLELLLIIKAVLMIFFESFKLINLFEKHCQIFIMILKALQLFSYFGLSFLEQQDFSFKIMSLLNFIRFG